MKYYDVGLCLCGLERTSSGYFLVEEFDVEHDSTTRLMFSNEVEALKEILSFAQVSAEDYAEYKGENND